MDLFEYVDSVLNFFRLPIWRYLIYGIIFVLIIIWLSFVYWTYRDTRLRNNSITAAIFWALIVFLFNFLGLIIYLILRPPEYIEDVRERDLEIERMQLLLDANLSGCPSCGNKVTPDFLICPHCRKKLKNPCISCGKPLEFNWKVCPYCRTAQ